MQTPTSNPHSSAPYTQQSTDLFHKYIFGVGVTAMPFKLFKAESTIKKQRKKCGVRGPYRRYTSD